MRRNIPSLNWLRVFEAAARVESFARAAELLNIGNVPVHKTGRGGRTTWHGPGQRGT